MHVDLSLAATMLGMLGMVLAFFWFLVKHVILDPQRAMLENFKDAVAKIEKLVEKMQETNIKLEVNMAHLEELAENAHRAAIRAHDRLDALTNAQGKEGAP